MNRVNAPARARNATRIATLLAVVAVAGLATFAVISVMQDAPAASSPSGPSASVTPMPTSVSPTGSASTLAIEEGIVQVLVDDLRLRESPSTDADAVATLWRGQVVRATGRAEVHDAIMWVEIGQRPSGRMGWVAAAGANHDPWLAMVRDGPIGVTAGTEVELIDLASDRRTVITSNMNVQDLAFAPDGERVALIDPFHSPRVVALDVITSPEPTSAPGSAYGPPAMLYPAFAPDGEAVAFLRGQDSLELTFLWLGAGDPPAIPTPLTIHPLSWAPDSRHIASAALIEISGDGGGDWEIVVASPGDSDFTRLTNRRGIDVSPAWSPDGSAIAYLQDAGPGTVALAIMDADGSDQRTLLTFDGNASAAAQPAWSPDGSRVAIAQFLEDSPAMVHLVDVQTSQHLSIGAPGPECSDLAWSPTGTHIAFVCGDLNLADQSAYVTLIESPEVIDLGPAVHIDWARTLHPISP